jgi:multicomponent Na+:H+ antiporter subunit E
MSRRHQQRARAHDGEDNRLRLVSFLLGLFAFWLLLSGHYHLFLMSAGLLSALAVALFARRMDMIDHEGHPVHLALRAVVSYWPWLIKEIAKSAWTVSKIILNPRLPISPTLVRVAATQKTAVGRTTFANSITLTPGTISVEVDGDHILVHALTREAAQDLAGGEMDRRVTAFERAG